MHSVAFVASARLTSNTPHSAGPQLRIRRGRRLRRCRRTVRLNILQAAAYNRHAFALRWLRSRARQKTMCGEYVSMRVCECARVFVGVSGRSESAHKHTHTHPHSQREPNPLHYPRVLVFSIPRMALAISSVAVSAGLAAKRLHGSGMRCGMNDLPTGRPTDRPNRPADRASDRASDRGLMNIYRGHRARELASEFGVRYALSAFNLIWKCVRKRHDA